MAEKGGYLCYSPDSFGTLSLHWSETKVEDALAFFAAGKPIPPFKFKTNQGRFQLQKGTDDKTKFFEGWGAFLKEGLCRFNATKIEVYGKANSREEVQLVLLDKSALKVLRVMPGETWEGSCDEVLSFAIVPKDNTAFKVGTLAHAAFMTKGRKEGFCYEVGSTGPTQAAPTGERKEMVVYKNNSVPTTPSNAFKADSSAPQAPSVAEAAEASAPVNNWSAAPSPADAPAPMSPSGTQQSMTTEPVPEVAATPASPTANAKQSTVSSAGGVPALEETVAAEEPAAPKSPKVASPTAAGDDDDEFDEAKEPATPTTTAEQPASGAADLLDLGGEEN